MGGFLFIGNLSGNDTTILCVVCGREIDFETIHNISVQAHFCALYQLIISLLGELNVYKESDISTKKNIYVSLFSQNAIRWHNFFFAIGNQVIMRLSESGKNTKVSCRQSQQKCGVATQKTRKSAFFGTTLCRKVNVYAVLTTTRTTTKLYNGAV